MKVKRSGRDSALREERGDGGLSLL
jgi:hypothetical protein